MNSTTTNPAIITKISNHDFADLFLNHGNHHHSLHSIISFTSGAVITHFKAAAYLKEPSRFTVQVSDDVHIILSPEFIQYINHSCEPNVFFDTSTMEITALRQIQPGDELTFFYPSTEWDMAEPFDCLCGKAACLHKIQGAKHLSSNKIQSYKLTQYIGDKYRQLHS